jgi:putative DNA methylase
VSNRPRYPKRLIEVDLPIKRISAHARREKSIRHGHISTLHIWWARRPLAACRAVICAALWPDPADPDCPVNFIDFARKEMLNWTSHDRQKLLSKESQKRFEAAPQKQALFNDNEQLRGALLDFIADFANWDNSTVSEFLATSRALTQAAHEALGGTPGTKPLVVDPFAGGGSIPLEALRVGADAFASDLNPIPVLLNKVVLEYIPKYGQRLADEVRRCGEWIKKEAEKELSKFYPKDPNGATPIAYLWARTIQCEGPGCGTEMPLIRSLWLAKKSDHSVALQFIPRPKAKNVDIHIIVKQRDGWVDQDAPITKILDSKFDGTVQRGSATCPCCGYTTPVGRVREQLKARRGGADDARLLCVVTSNPKDQGRLFRLPTTRDIEAIQRAKKTLDKSIAVHQGDLSLVPDEPVDKWHHDVNRLPMYGMTTWGDMFSPRAALCLTTLIRLLHSCKIAGDDGLKIAVRTCLAFTIDRQADYTSTLCSWAGDFIRSSFGRQALAIVWDFAEVYPFSGQTGDFQGAIDWVVRVLTRESKSQTNVGHAEQADATSHPLPDDSASALITDPPYYDSIDYAVISNFYYVWLRRSMRETHGVDLTRQEAPKDREIVVDSTTTMGHGKRDARFFEEMMTEAFRHGVRYTVPSGIAIVVFAHKSTSGWEAQLKALIDSNWIITASWPIDTERPGRMRAIDSAALASSVHLVCRPRENPDGSIRADEVGDWRDVLGELPHRIHEWMPRLAEEGVVGADAIFACLGPALEIFSSYSRVEKASGETITLKEYLEEVWAAVAREALTMIFTGADATGFEEDARLTAMWLWTLKTGDINETDTIDDIEEDDEAGSAKKGKIGGFVLEYDAARKIGQGLGAHLENLSSVVEVSGETARLLPVAERAAHLFGKDEGKATPIRKKKKPQLDLFKGLQVAEETGPTFGETEVSRVGDTVLDRIHQSMILFAGGRSEALRRFLVDDGAGTDQRFWRLAQALSALYPGNTDEKRWVDGVLARKKGLGL